jgi:hypothetical protein
MNTDKHRSNKDILSAFIRVHLWLAACGESRRRPKAYSTRTADHSSAVVEQAFSPAFGPRYDFRHGLPIVSLSFEVANA